MKISAIRACKDSKGIQRQAGEQWLVRDLGFYIPHIDERAEELVSAKIITEKAALRLKASHNFKDVYGIERRAGEEWLITTDVSSSHIVDTHEISMGFEAINVLTEDEFCYIENPFREVDGKWSNQLGKTVLVKGPTAFFVQPGEMIKDSQGAYILKEDQALLLKAL